MSTTTFAVDLARLARPKQWLKNLLVVTAPLAAGLLFTPNVFFGTLLAFICFCLAASSTYMVNDVVDAAADRKHQTKQNRPVASGRISPRVAIVTAFICAVISVALPLFFRNAQLCIIICSYLLLQLAYMFYLKHEPVFDIATIAAGFLLRALAGGTSLDAPMSHAFLIVVGFGSLFMAVGKRFSEASADNGAETRHVLQQYTLGYLRLLLGISASIVLVGYILWAFEIDSGGFPFAPLSIIPFTLAIMRYAREAEQAKAEAPEDAVFADKALLVLGLIWLALFAGQVFF